jgi:argininosuccinate lyase
MAAQLEAGLLATELADYLVRRGLPFREAHYLAGRVVRLGEERGMAITELSITDLRSVTPHFGDDVTYVLNVPAALAARAITGGTAPDALRSQLDLARTLL